jgi:methylenetetrahydrofolate reductase (NADPH)
VDTYLRFVDRARGAGITVPIVPGILPITNYAQLKRFAGICGAKVPDWLASLFDGSDANPELRGLLAATIAAEQCRLLRAAGVEEFHFYTLNRAKLTLAICHILGIRAPLPARP